MDHATEQQATPGLRARLKARPDSEHEQAVLRIVIVGTVLVWLSLTFHPGAAESDKHTYTILVWLGGYVLVALGIFVSICRWPGVNVPRRLVGMLGDNLTATVVMFATYQAGFAMIGCFLFVAFGNGFRYGGRYLFASSAMALAGFGSVLLHDDYWATLQTAGWSLFVAMIVLPLYVSTLLKRIQESQRIAEDANRAKSTFLANMSHEMRTPLNGVVGVIDLLRATTLSPQQNELMRLLAHSAAVLRSLVDDVLDISKIEAGRLQIEIAEFDLHAILNGLIQLLRPHSQAKALSLRAAIDPALDYRVRGDEHHLRQVLLNLVSNAIKFTQRGEIQVSVAMVNESLEGYRVRFEVTDTGIGIPEEARARIFERFVQADDSTTRRFGGTGLGTTIAKQLVDLMGGAIGVKSELGRGSTFWFEIPLLKNPIAAPITEATAQQLASTALVVAGATSAAVVQPLVAGAAGHVAAAPGVDEAVAQLRELAGRGVSVPAIVVTGNIEEATEVLERVAAERGDLPTALIYLTSDVALARAEPRLRRIDALQVLPVDSPRRHIHNAIHAATARADGAGGAEVIDLAAVLEERRQPMKILVADDNATNLAIITRLLEQAGHHVIPTSDGEAALDVYERDVIELAILDFNMPLRNGIEVTAAVRAMEAPGSRLPIIILSASVTPEAKDRARASGADEFMGKPYDATRLLRLIDRLAHRAGRAPAGEATLAATTAMERLPLIDAQRMRDVEQIATTPDFLVRLLRGFCDDVELMLKKLETAVTDGRADVVADALHAISGAALSVGASQLAARVKSTVALLRSGRTLHVAAAIPDMRLCFNATARELSGFLEAKHQVSM